MTNSQIEMKLHKIVDRLSQVEAKVEQALAIIEKAKDTKETTPIDRNYRDFK